MAFRFSLSRVLMVVIILKLEHNTELRDSHSTPFMAFIC